MYIVQSSDSFSVRPAYLVCICGKCLITFKVKLHSFVDEHLSHNSTLVNQISQYEKTLAYLDKWSIHLNPVLNPTYKLLVAIFTGSQRHFIGFVFVILANVDYFYFDRELRLIIIGLV